MNKLQRILRDHKIMEAIRNHQGDIQLIACAGDKHTPHGRFSWDCAINQEDVVVYDIDPAEAIAKALKVGK